MKNKTLIIVAAVMAMVAAMYSAYWYGSHQIKPVVAGASDTPITSGAQAQKPLYWHDPMVPGQKFDKPGKSPFMDMPLVPVYAEEGQDAGAVKISPGVQQNLGVRTAAATTESLANSVNAIGSVAYDERNVVLVQARNNGYVERLYIRAPLDPVRKGQALAELYVPEWIAAQEEFLTVRRLHGSGVDDVLDAARQRMRLAGMSDDQIRSVESSDQVRSRIIIAAPRSGIVSDLAVREGTTVLAGAPLFRINGLDTVWVNAAIPESLASQVKPGTAVTAHAAALPGLAFRGKVGAILPEVDAETRTIKARIELANPDHQLVPGMFATLAFVQASGREALFVPTEAVIQTGTRSIVLVEDAPGKFHPVDVQVGAEANGKTEITKGLYAAQKVVVSGQFLIDSEASLKGTALRMGTGPAPVSAQPPAANSLHHGEGTVEQIGKDEISISHGPIASLQWGAMTMGFQLPAGGLPRNIVVGVRVAFDVRQRQDGSFEIVTIRPLSTLPGKSRGKDPSRMDSKPMPGSPTGGKK